MDNPASPARSGTPSNILFAAPHRPFFLAGVLQATLAFVPWVWELLSRITPLPAPVWPWPPGWVHGLVAAYGIFPFFVFGFLLTAMPRWQGLADTPGSAAKRPWLPLVAGWLGFYAGLALDLAALRVIGLLLVTVGWGLMLVALKPVAFAPGKPRLHPASAWYALAAGTLGLLAWTGFAASGNPLLARIGIEAGLWWLLAPLFTVVSHRMIPFFSGSVLPAYTPFKPTWTLAVLLGASVLHGAFAMADHAAWSWPVDLVAAATALWLSWKWQFRRSFAVRLLAMLHLGFLWVGIAWLLAGLQGLLHVAGIDTLGLAPLHALAAGFFATMTLGMVSRVSMGHSGRPLVADGLTWRLGLGLHGVATLRVLADVVPAAHGVFAALAGIGWLIVFLPWAWRLAPIYLRPRADGKPG